MSMEQWESEIRKATCDGCRNNWRVEDWAGVVKHRKPFPGPASHVYVNCTYNPALLPLVQAAVQADTELLSLRKRLVRSACGHVFDDVVTDSVDGNICGACAELQTVREEASRRMECGHLQADWVSVEPICKCGTHLGCLDTIDVARCPDCDALYIAHCRICAELQTVRDEATVAAAGAQQERDAAIEADLGVATEEDGCALDGVDAMRERILAAPLVTSSEGEKWLREKLATALAAQRDAWAKWCEERSRRIDRGTITVESAYMDASGYIRLDILPKDDEKWLLEHDAAIRLKEAKWWRYLVRMHEESYFAREGDIRIKELAVAQSARTPEK